MSEYPSYLIHYGVPGQKWGTRQYQNLDGTWTEEGKRRRRIGDDRGFWNLDESSGQHYKMKMGGSTSGTKAFIKDLKKEVEVINGGQKGHEYGLNRKVNCAFCAMSYELRRRGHDVRAQESLRGSQAYLTNPKASYGRVIPNYSKISKDARMFAKRESDQSSKMASIGMTKSEYDDMTKTLLNDGEGSRGFIAVDWKGGNGGHIFNYEVKNGQLLFIDAQPGTIMKADKKFYNQTMSGANNVETLRSDNLKINEEKAKKFYSEDTSTDIRINPAAKSAWVKELIGGSIGIAVGSLVGIPHMGAIFGVEIADSINQKKIKAIDDEASIELQKKWEEEGRFKNKWYDFVDDKKKTSSKSTDSAQLINASTKSRINSLASSGLTYEQIAKRLGISKSTVSKYIA